jgi:hypothetical protein
VSRKWNLTRLERKEVLSADLTPVPRSPNPLSPFPWTGEGGTLLKYCRVPRIRTGKSRLVTSQLRNPHVRFALDQREIEVTVPHGEAEPPALKQGIVGVGDHPVLSGFQAHRFDHDLAGRVEAHSIDNVGIRPLVEERAVETRRDAPSPSAVTTMKARPREDQTGLLREPNLECPTDRGVPQEPLVRSANQATPVKKSTQSRLFPSEDHSGPRSSPRRVVRRNSLPPVTGAMKISRSPSSTR